MGTKPSKPRPSAHQAGQAEEGTRNPKNRAASSAASNGSGADISSSAGVANSVVASSDVISEIASHVQDKSTLAALSLADKAAFEATAEAREKKKKESLWPSKMFEGYLGSNNSREAKGITPNGTKWTYYESNSRDLEDNDSRYVFTLGELKVCNDDECSRDFAENKTSVSFKGKQIFQSGDMRCRDQANQPMTSSGKDELLEVLKLVAAIEGVTVEELRAAMPVSI